LIGNTRISRSTKWLASTSRPRRESKTGRGHKGLRSSAIRPDPKEAARRRDFTINAISWDPCARPISIRSTAATTRHRVLRVVDPQTLATTPARAARVQFAARFEARLEPDTFAICRAIPLDDLPAERLSEVEKLLLRRARRSPPARVDPASSSGWAGAQALVGCEQDPGGTPTDADGVDGARKRLVGLIAGAPTVMLGAVTHDFGKPATTAFIDGHTAAARSRGRRRGRRRRFRSPEHPCCRRLRRPQARSIVSDHLAPGIGTSRRRRSATAPAVSPPRASSCSRGRRSRLRRTGRLTARR
jgi:tRNA nucleotidyltransferase (CCA-adding enzyme)